MGKRATSTLIRCVGCLLGSVAARMINEVWISSVFSLRVGGGRERGGVDGSIYMQLVGAKVRIRVQSWAGAAKAANPNVRDGGRYSGAAARQRHEYAIAGTAYARRQIVCRNVTCQDVRYGDVVETPIWYIEND